MLRALFDAHLAPALAWSRAEPVTVRALAVAAIGMGAPVVAGLALGRDGTGFTIGLGAMLLATGSEREAGSARDSLAAALPALLAVVAASLITALPGRDGTLVGLAMLAATISGYSRPVATGAIRFLIYFVLCATLLESAGAHRGGAALLFGAGALWNLAVRAMLMTRGAVPEPAEVQARVPTRAQRRAHLRRSVRTAAGWQFAARLGAGLAAAIAVRDAWPSHHYGWVVLTVALLTQRPLERLPVRIIQRMLGTAAGVAAAWLLLAHALPVVVLGAIVCVLATLAPWARGNYLAWSAVSSPVILLVMDLGRPIETALLADRLVATLAGAAIVVAANFAAEWWLASPP